VLGVLTYVTSCVSITKLNGRRSFLSTIKNSLEGFKLFYEELTPPKVIVSRLRRARPALATSK